MPTFIKGAICLGGTNIELKSGYWRKHKLSEDIILCLKYGIACLGGVNNTCKTNY